MPCYALYLQVFHDQNNKDLKQVHLPTVVENRCQFPQYEVTSF